MSRYGIFNRCTLHASQARQPLDGGYLWGQSAGGGGQAVPSPVSSAARVAGLRGCRPWSATQVS